MRGSIRQGRDRDGNPRPGVWEIRAYAGRDARTGKPRQVSRTVHGGRRKAEDALRTLNNEIAAGRFRSSSGTVAHLLERYVRHLEELGRSPSTIYGYRAAIRHNIEPAIGHLQVRDLTTKNLDDLYSDWRHREPKPMAPSTVHQQHSILSGALRQAERWQWLPPGASPARNASPGQARRNEPNPPSVPEVLRLLEVAKAKDALMGDMLHLAAHTGARRGELCAIRWSDVDLEGRRLVIDESVLSMGRQMETKGTKTYRSRRIALDVAAARMISQRMAGQERAAEVAGAVLDDDPFLFSPRLTGDQPMKPDRVTGFVRRLRVECGLPGLKLHHLRHWMATEMLGDGTDVRTVAGRLGHSNASTTLNIYAHFLAEKDRDAADRIGGLLSGDRLEFDEMLYLAERRRAQGGELGEG